MKPYNERLPLIDAAVEELHGKFPPTAIGYSGRGYYAKGDAANILHKINFGDVCTRQEFEQRVKELGWINGYKLGVEYETNGEKPDLPDDTVIEIESTGGDRDLGSRFVKYNDWTRTKSFRIVDGRYKPKEQEMNDWYEKGELPPVGTECEYIIGEHRGRHNPCTFVGLDSRGSIVIETDDGEYLSYHNYQIKFRPLRTETDKLVDEVEKLLDGCESVSNRAIAHAIINAGYRKIKPMSEQEFMKQCIDICGHGDTRLYRAGCRFIDKGE